MPGPAALDALIQARQDAPNKKTAEATMDEIVKYHVALSMPTQQQLEQGCVLKTTNGQGIWLQPNDMHLTVNHKSAVSREIRCTDGSLFVLDDVLLPSPLNLIQTLRADSRFSLFVAALDATGNADLLDRTWLFTVLAPSDDAIRSSMGGSWMELIKPEHIEDLRRFVRRHLVAGRVFSDEMRAAKLVSTGDMQMPVTGDSLATRIGSATLTQLNLNATNGVIHVLSRPFWP